MQSQFESEYLDQSLDAFYGNVKGSVKRGVECSPHIQSVLWCLSFNGRTSDCGSESESSILSRHPKVMAEDPFNFFLPSMSPASTNVLECPGCGKTFEWVQSIFGNIGVGLDKPKCPYCGGKECRPKW
jgi:hypothetical protein